MTATQWVRISPSILVAGASLVSRLSVLLLLVAAATELPRAEFNVIVYILTVSSAAQVLADPGTAELLLTRWPQLNTAGPWSAWLAGLRLQLLAGGVILVATPCIVAVVSPSERHFFLAASLGLLAAVEGFARYTRVPWQANHRFGSFAAVDLLVAAGRLFTMLALVVIGRTRGLTLGSLVVAGLLSLIPFKVARSFERPKFVGRLSSLALAGEVWPYGASTFFSSLYSQGPAVLLGLAGSVQAAAIYSVVSRLTQPTELVPNAISAVCLPRLVMLDDHERRRAFRAQAAVAAVAGFFFAALIMAASPLLLRLFGLGFDEGWAIVLILALVLPVKFVNYQLVALSLAQGRIRARLVAGARVATVSIIAVLAVARQGAVPVALVTLGSELLLSTLLTFASSPVAIPAASNTT